MAGTIYYYFVRCLIATTFALLNGFQIVNFGVVEALEKLPT